MDSSEKQNDKVGEIDEAEEIEDELKITDMDDTETPTKEEYEVAKFLRFNVPSKEGKLMGMAVQYFLAYKAVDSLLDSKWASGKSKTELRFTNRNSCIDYCNRLLEKGIFHRATRVEKKKDRDKKKKKAKEEAEEDSEKAEKKPKKEKKTKRGKDEEKEEESSKEKESAGEVEEKKETDKKDSEKKDEDKKKKRKLRLEMADQQLFMDGDEVYVWIYDPVPLKSKLIGLLMVLGAIAVCLFPLWPPEVRLGVYYLSLAAAGFVGFILSLCIVQRVLFAVTWLVTFGKHHFWLLPNLTEDVGFFESFKPLYKHDVCPGKKDKTDKEKTNPEGTGGTTEDGTKEQEEGEEGEEGEGDNDNGYEMVDREELDHVEDVAVVAEGETKKTK